MIDKWNKTVLFHLSPPYLAKVRIASKSPIRVRKFQLFWLEWMEDTRKNSKANSYVNQNSVSVSKAWPIEQYAIYI